MITKQELLNKCYGGQPVWDDECEATLKAVNILRKRYGKPMYVSCFYRSVEYDKAKGRTGKSQHCLKRAVDFVDQDGALDRWLMTTEGQIALKEAGLWLEDPKDTSVWSHVDRLERKNRVFIPK